MIPHDFPPKLAKILAERVREEAARGQMDIILQPRIERDPRLLLRMHDRFNTVARASVAGSASSSRNGSAPSACPPRLELFGASTSRMPASPGADRQV